MKSTVSDFFAWFVARMMTPRKRLPNEIEFGKPNSGKEYEAWWDKQW